MESLEHYCWSWIEFIFNSISVNLHYSWLSLNPMLLYPKLNQPFNLKCVQFARFYWVYFTKFQWNIKWSLLKLKVCACASYSIVGRFSVLLHLPCYDRNWQGFGCCIFVELLYLDHQTSRTLSRRNAFHWQKRKNWQRGPQVPISNQLIISPHRALISLLYNKFFAIAILVYKFCKDITSSWINYWEMYRIDQTLSWWVHSWPQSNGLPGNDWTTWLPTIRQRPPPTHLIWNHCSL